MNGTSAGSNAKVWAIVALLVLAGSYLRLANLGELGFRWDEDLSSLAVQAILEKGFPELPSGMVYLRGGAFLYVMAASAELFGFSEFALRLPAALFGIAMIPLAFAFGRALFDQRIGLLVAALITFSIWDIEFSRYARMYAPFAVFYLLTLLSLWKYRVESESRVGSALCVVLAVITISLHQLGYTLAIAFFFPLILRGPADWLQPRRWAYPLVAGGMVAGFFLFWNGFMSRYREIPVTASAVENAGMADPALAAEGVAAAAGAGGAQAAWLTRTLLGALPDLPVLGGLVDRAPLVLAAIASALLVSTALYVRRSSAPMADRIVLWLITACCLLQLFNIALLAVILLAFLKREGLPAFRRADVLFAIGVVCVSFVVWLALAVGLGLGGADPVEGGRGLRGAVRSLLDYPHFFVFWGYPNEWPLVSVAAIAGMGWAFDRASRRDPSAGITASAGVAYRASGPEAGTAVSPDAQRYGPNTGRAAGFLSLALATPMIVNGLFETAFQLFRYNVPFNPYYFGFVALGLVHWRDVVMAWGGSVARRDLRRPAAAAGTVLLVLLVVGFELNPLRGLLATERSYRNDGLLYRAFDMERYSDFKTPAAFVAESASSDDMIVVLDSREYFNYLGRLDYWVRTGVYETQTYKKDGKLRDQYVGTPLIMSLGELKETLRAPGREKWLIASDAMLAETRAVTDDIKKFILEQDEHVVYVGRDDHTKVYRFD